MQAIVDSNKKFIDVHCGEPGAMHDARLFRRSHFYRKICEQPDLIIPGGVILGDSAYPDKPYLITPFKDFGNLTRQQNKFNYLHSSTRMVVENAFGLLKTRFRRLKFFEGPNIGFIVNCVVATCVLHNICIDANDLEEWVDLESNDDDSGGGTDMINPENGSAHREQMFSLLLERHLLD
ncbi:uncharacterized protein LOC129909576 [Episyrphus balteatus]|uniref:uncharacterized protein LOC129909576 n=1 Tax=Episyrphus balteatus TaxID=286459 RepID=UPI00248589F1|nr:uncharacterized protein LOC129909576 [Episyrphus balteatus]